MTWLEALAAQMAADAGKPNQVAWCNHDAPAIRDGVCECGQIVTLQPAHIAAEIAAQLDFIDYRYETKADDNTVRLELTHLDGKFSTQHFWITVQTLHGTALAMPEEDEMPEELQERYVEAARNRHQEDGEVEIDDGAVVSDSDEGAYVAAWVWVDKSDVEGEEAA